MIQKQQLLNLVVAHKLEAKPLIAMLGMERIHSVSTYPLFQNQQGVSLIIAGMGKLAANDAVACMAKLQDSDSSLKSAWLNIGIAGHQSAAVGSGLLAHKITDGVSGDSFYPPQLLSGLKTSDIITVDEPEFSYPEDAAYEMEAFGFYAAATQLATAELVQVYKIVSDNPSNPATDIDRGQIANWIDAQSDAIHKLVQHLSDLVNEVNRVYGHPQQVAQLCARFSLTVTQRTQLIRLCQRYHALGQGARLQLLADRGASSAKQLINGLAENLADFH